MALVGQEGAVRITWLYIRGGRRCKEPTTSQKNLEFLKLHWYKSVVSNGVAKVIILHNEFVSTIDGIIVIQSHNSTCYNYTCFSMWDA